MFKILRQSIRTGVVTRPYPDNASTPPPGFRGKPVIDFSACTACGKCADACPTDAITLQPSGENESEAVLTLSYGACIFCGACEEACPDAISLTQEFQLARQAREELAAKALYARQTDGTMKFLRMLTQPASTKERSLEDVGTEVKGKIQELYGRSLQIREVDAGSCNGCEIEITALSNAVYDIERFGIHFVASPRHADMLLVTGPVTRNMEIALKETYDATPEPRLVVAVGACAISGGIFGKSYASCGGVDTVVPVDVYIPGCPPRPEALLQGILRALGRKSLS